MIQQKLFQIAFNKWTYFDIALMFVLLIKLKKIDGLTYINKLNELTTVQLFYFEICKCWFIITNSLFFLNLVCWIMIGS